MKRTLLLIFSTALLFAQNVIPTSVNKTVTTAGTPVRLSSANLIVLSATVQALHSNTGRVCVGGSAVLVSTNTGSCLSADQALALLPNGTPGGQKFDLSAFWLDSAVNAEGVSITYYVAQ